MNKIDDLELMRPMTREDWLFKQDIVAGRVKCWHYTSAFSIPHILRSGQIHSSKHYTPENYPADGWDHPQESNAEFIEKHKKEETWFTTAQQLEATAAFGHRLEFSNPEQWVKAGLFRIGVNFLDVDWNWVMWWGQSVLVSPRTEERVFQMTTEKPVPMDVWSSVQILKDGQWIGYDETNIDTFKKLVTIKNTMDFLDKRAPQPLPPRVGWDNLFEGMVLKQRASESSRDE